MSTPKADIITHLKKEILSLQGFNRTATNNNELNTGLGSIKHAFPNSSFPLGAIHEFICNNIEEMTASSGFIAGILSTLMHQSGVSIWISSSHSIFPPALKSFNIAPDKIIFVKLQNEKDILWTIEEALKCEGLSAVIGEIRDLSFTASRRLQLAVEQSRVTGFILVRACLPKPCVGMVPRTNSVSTTACVTRWKITHLPCELEDDMPGVGFPRWNVELLKVRNGKPGIWSLEWINGRFNALVRVPRTNNVPRTNSVSPTNISTQKKTG